MYRRFLSVPLVGNDEASLLEDVKEAFSGDSAGFKEASQAHAAASKMVRQRKRTHVIVGLLLVVRGVDTPAIECRC